MSPVKYDLGFYIPEDGILHSDRGENLKSYTFWTTIIRLRSCKALPLVIGYPPRRSEFESCSGHIGFVVYKAALGRVSSEFFGFSCHSFAECSAVIFNHGWYNRPFGGLSKSVLGSTPAQAVPDNSLGYTTADL
jgi:hypothetical protein